MGDGVRVTTADAIVLVERERDREQMFELLRESLKRQALLARKFNRMRKAYRAALPLWRGTPFADVVDARWAESEQTRLRARYTAASGGLAGSADLSVAGFTVSRQAA